MRISDILYYLIILAIIYTLVRPGSPAAAAVKALADASVGAVGAATGYLYHPVGS